jgi:hypothetical protein
VHGEIQDPRVSGKLERSAYATDDSAPYVVEQGRNVAREFK